MTASLHQLVLFQSKLVWFSNELCYLIRVALISFFLLYIQKFFFILEL